MSNALYDHARALMLGKGNASPIDWENDTINCCLVAQGTDSAVSSPDAVLDNIAPAARDYGLSGDAGVILPTPSVESNGAANGGQVTFQSVSGSTIGAVMLYKVFGGTDASPLILWLDTATGLPITPNGGDIIITWDTGVNKIFRP